MRNKDVDECVSDMENILSILSRAHAEKVEGLEDTVKEKEAYAESLEDTIDGLRNELRYCKLEITSLNADIQNLQGQLGECSGPSSVLTHERRLTLGEL